MKKQIQRHKKWTEDDKNKLIELVNVHIYNKRIQWQTISEIMGRSVNECKTYYRNVLEYESTSTEQQTEAQLGVSTDTLMKFIYFYGNDWETLKSYFQYVDENDLSKEYQSLEKKLNNILPLVDTIRKNNGVIECDLIEKTLPQKDLSYYIYECQKCSAFMNRLQTSDPNLIFNGHELIDVAVHKKMKDDKIDEMLDRVLDYFKNKNIMSNISEK